MLCARPDLHAFLLKLPELRLNSPVSAPAGVVQIPGPPGVGPGHAHHHLRRHKTRSRDAVSQLAEVAELTFNLRSFHLNFLA